MHTAPPTVPGMPWANSSPVSPCRQANSASRARGTPDSANTVSGSPPDSRRFRPAEVSITSRSRPSSGTSRLVPLPITRGRAPQSRANSNRRAACSPRSGKAIRLAGPPIRNEVWRLMGSPQITRRSGRCSRTQLSNDVSQDMERPPHANQITRCSSAAPRMPASLPSSARTTRVARPPWRAKLSRSTSSRRGSSSRRSGAAATPPPRTTTSGRRRLARLMMPSAR